VVFDLLYHRGAAVQRADAQLGSGALGAELRRQVEQLRQDQQMFAAARAVGRRSAPSLQVA
jgi:hypothetical protein